MPNWEVVLAAVAQNGYALMYGSDELKADREVVLAAVARNGGALWYASAELKADREVVLAAVAHYRTVGYALRSGSDELKADREVVLAAVAQNGQSLSCVSAELQADREVVLTAVTEQEPRRLRPAARVGRAADNRPGYAACRRSQAPGWRSHGGRTVATGLCSLLH